MSDSNKKVCLGCMREISAEDVSCPHCGFNPSTYQPNPRCLQLASELAGKYVIGKVLGEGGFGITYIGWDLRLEMPVAIKEYFPPKIASRDATSGNNTIYMFDNANEKSFEDGMKRCVKEAKSMSKLESLLGIVSIRDFFHENQTAYIIMEYVDGVTLKEYLKDNGKMPAEDVFYIMKPVMKALEQMHKLGLIHRDISPDNIMIRSDGQVKLIDFGAARAAMAEDDEKSLTVMLKRGFTPEEQYRTKGHQGEWTDVYALCATMYYMLTGTVPPEAMERLLEDEYVSISQCDISIDATAAVAIDKGLQVRAKDRFQNMTDLMLAIYGEENAKVLDVTNTSGGTAAGVEETVLVDSEATVLVEDPVMPSNMAPGKGAPKAQGQKGKSRSMRSKSQFVAVPVIVIVAIIAIVIGINMSKKDNSEQVVETGSKAVTTGEENPSSDAGAVKNETQTPAEATTEVAPEATPADMSATPATMINVVGMQQEDAKSQLLAIDGAMNIQVSEEYDDKQKAGTVLSQDVPEGQQWQPGTDVIQINLVVSKGEKKISVPNVRGKTKSTATAKLKKAGLKVKTSEKYSSSVKKGKVISQSKKAGSEVKKGTQVTLVISKGKKPQAKPATPSYSSSNSSSSSSSSSRRSSSSSKKSSKKKSSSGGFNIVGEDDYVSLN